MNDSKYYDPSLSDDFDIDLMDTPIDGEYLTEMPKVVEAVVPTQKFMKQWKKMTSGNISVVQDYLMENPELNNPLLKGKQYKDAAGIARKIRWNLSANTASRTGDARIINAYISESNKIYLLICYPKSAQEDLSPVQIKYIVKAIRDLKGE